MVKVILTQNIPGKGKKDQVIEASEGFVRNFLLPQKKAILATPENIKKNQLMQTSLKKREEELQKELLRAKEKIKSLKIVVKKKISEGGKIFGSVTSAEIFETLKKEGLELKNAKVNFQNLKKELGDYTIEIALDKKIKANLQLRIEKE